MTENILPEEVKRYLSKYSLEGWKLECSTADDIHLAIVIPAIQEYNNIRKLLSSLAENDPKYFRHTLIVFVINNTARASEEVYLDNGLSLELLRNIISLRNPEDPVVDKVTHSGLKLAFVDASSKGLELPEKDGGVGLARKIGMDLTLSAFSYSTKKNAIACLDADCTVEKNYITSLYEAFSKNKLHAAYVNFRHTITSGTPDESTLAIICYEIFLRYYVLGLQAAGSPYGFHTIGSTMACSYESYIKIEGMNKRKAAEDFYFMEKLSKNTEIHKIDSTTVYPSGRGSWRVPFGTGQRVNRFISHSHDEYQLYSPESFYVLKDWLRVFNSSEVYDAGYYLDKAGEIHPSMRSFLEEQNFSRDWKKILANSKSGVQISRQKKLWFDGFRTLKLIHFLRDNGFPPDNMFDALDEVFSRMGIHFQAEREKGAIPPFEVQIQYLEKLREIA
ncbi:MAG: glycosyltransferase family 2 protein [Ignavibacteria bacterium]|jgi:glycosyltransferase involved in cell wall biosynthesis|nr:glycosyltransferase family 2 protein [Ignavibacteria bacterium]MCU7498474.1 glycosyltransferase family 2 protein [Ignavibacteria bacterium]MCU7512628.1 glycosyltransferase family 2 protein [Ignavibacteria bacterium]MCU7521236.1 glycosyltransferase family 2 protein [Ignavibacteria bacterium]MCU7525040.1 glycosyltransferase family 2 protein [Ignavibacteria bacterium]